jgi:hypothetical protein
MLCILCTAIRDTASWNDRRRSANSARTTASRARPELVCAQIFGDGTPLLAEMLQHEAIWLNMTSRTERFVEDCRTRASRPPQTHCRYKAVDGPSSRYTTQSIPFIPNFIKIVVQRKGKEAVVLGGRDSLGLHNVSMPGIDVTFAPSVHHALSLVVLERGHPSCPCNRRTVR